MCKPRVYVAGPIAGQSFEGATAWRDYAQERLPECEILTPMRGKDYLQAYAAMPLTSAELLGNGKRFKGSTVDAEISSERAIHGRDTWDVGRCDLVFANFLPGDEAGKVSIGTGCEVYLAKYLHIPVVEILTLGGIHDHPFITGSAWVVVETVEEGFHVARIALNLPVL